jgi:hypothetical protein
MRGASLWTLLCVGRFDAVKGRLLTSGLGVRKLVLSMRSTHCL